MLPSQGDRIVQMRDVSKLPPSNIDAEKTVLGGLIFDPNALSRVESFLEPALFSLQGHQIVCQAILSISAEGGVADLLNVTTRINDEGNLERIGGQMALLGLLDACVSTVNIDQHVELLVDKKMRRDALKLANKLRIQAHTPEPITETISACADELQAIALDRTSRACRHIVDVVCDVWQEIEDNSEGRNKIGFDSGFIDLDPLMGPLMPGNLVTIAGDTGTGKTSFALQVAVLHIAIVLKQPVIVFSMEMTAEELTFRLAGMLAGVQARRIQEGRLNKSESAAVNEALRQLSELPLEIHDSGSVSVAEVRAESTRFKMQNGGKLGAIVVDYLQLMSGPGSTPYERISGFSKSMKAIAQNMKTVVISLSQLNRSPSRQTNKRPNKHDLLGAGTIENDSNKILLLYRDELYNSDSPDRGVCEVIVDKNRGGGLGVVKLLFEDRFTRFRNLAR